MDGTLAASRLRPLLQQAAVLDRPAPAIDLAGHMVATRDIPLAVDVPCRHQRPAVGQQGQRVEVNGGAVDIPEHRMRLAPRMPPTGPDHLTLITEAKGL